MNVLVIAAHPDDEVLGCGGTIARLADEGHDVSIAILGEGIMSRYDEERHADRSLLKKLQAHSRKVGKMLGAKDVSLYGFPDNKFDVVPLLEIIKVIEKLVEKIQPEVIYTQHGGDLNIDHATLFRAVMTITRPIKGGPIRAVYAFEVNSSTEWAFQKFAPVFCPNVFVDISQTLDRKVAAMKMYKSEVRRYPHPRSPEALRAVAQRWGSTAGVDAAEAFELIREIQ